MGTAGVTSPVPDGWMTCMRVDGTAAPGTGGNTEFGKRADVREQPVQVLHLAPQVVDRAPDVVLAFDHAGRDEQDQFGALVLERLAAEQAAEDRDPGQQRQALRTCSAGRR